MIKREVKTRNLESFVSSEGEGGESAWGQGGNFSGGTENRKNQRESEWTLWSCKYNYFLENVKISCFTI